MKRIIIIFAILSIFLCSQAHATTYYVASSANGGSDSNDGLSGDDEGGGVGPWESISKVNSFSFSAGDDVYFKCGDTWTISGNTVLDIDWSGSSANHVVIGSYYMLDGVETIGVQGTKPTLDGGSYITGTYPTWTWTSVAPTNAYRALIRAVWENTYVDIENFRTINSGGYGIWVGGFSQHMTVSNCYVAEIYGSGIQLKDTQYGTVSNNEIYHANRCFTKAGGDGGQVPSGIGAVRMDYYTIEKNYVHEGWGEAIGVFYNSDHNIIQYNKVADHMRAGIYLSCAQNNIIRYNLVYGTDEAAYTKHTYDTIPYVGAGLWIDDESSTAIQTHGVSTGNEWYGNLVSYTNHGFKVATYWPEATFNNSRVYNNTFVGNHDQLNSYALSSAKVTNSEIKNNIFWDSEGTGLDSGFPATCDGLTVDYNHWSSTPSVALLQGTNDITSTPSLAKTSNWQDGNARILGDFVIQSGDGGVDQGVDLGTPYNVVLSEDSDFTYPFTIITIVRIDSTPWDIGGTEYVGGITPPPPTGTGVISQDNYAYNCVTTGVATSITVPITIVADADYGIATVWWSSSVARTISSITFNSTAMTASVNLTTSTYNSSATFYILDTDMPSAGTYNLIVTMSAAPDAYLSAAMETLIGAAQQAPSATNSAHDTDNNGSVTTAITTTADNSWVVDSIQSSWAQTGTSDQTTDLMSACIRARGQSHKQVNTAGATNMVWTINGSSLYHLLLAIEPSGSGSYIDPTIDSVGIYNTSTTAYSTSESDSITAIDEYLYIALETSKQFVNNSTPESSRLVLDLESPEGETINAAWYGHIQATGGEWLLVYQLRTGYSWEGQWVRKGFKWLTSDLQVNSIDIQDAIFKDGDGNSLNTDLTSSGTDVGSITFNIPMAADYSLPRIGGSCVISNGYVH